MAILLRGARILIVDDDVNTVEALQSLLEDEGYQVETASSGAAALARLGAATFDLLLTDLHLPDLDGVSLAQQAQAATGCAVLLMTGSVRVQDGAGFAYVMKPLDVEILLVRLDELLARRATPALAAPREPRT